MMTTTPTLADSDSKPLLTLYQVKPEQPWLWLARGWRDFLRAPRTSLAYGAAITAISLAIVATLAELDRAPMVLPMLAGFALVCPWLAVGLYATSRTLSLNRPVSLSSILNPIRGNRDQIALMGVFLMLIHIFWIQIATLLFVIFVSDTHEGLSDLADLLLTTPSGFCFLLIGTAIGGLLAVFTFTVSVIALPMLIDSDVSVISAMVTSYAVVSLNRVPMALWAAIIAGITILCIATGFLALIVAMPLLGYASWHAYRDLVSQSPTQFPPHQ